MKIILSEKQAERIFKDKVTCDKCEHFWDVENNDKHPYLCHDCGWDNKKKNYNQKELFNFWKKEHTKKEIDEKWSEKYKK